MQEKFFQVSLKNIQVKDTLKECTKYAEKTFHIKDTKKKLFKIY